MQDIELEGTLKERAKKEEQEAKSYAAREKEKEEQIRKNRKNEWTVFWQGGAPQ